jgi:hypothetical protein
MSKCTCSNRARWRVVLYRHHHTRPNGTKSAAPIKSDASFVHCDLCNALWKTTAKYVEALPGEKSCRCVIP